MQLMNVLLVTVYYSNKLFYSLILNGIVFYKTGKDA